MDTFLLGLATFLGFIAGFALGLLAIRHVTKGVRMQEILQSKKARVLLGLFGWFFALCGAYIGYKLMEYRLGLA